MFNYINVATPENKKTPQTFTAWGEMDEQLPKKMLRGKKFETIGGSIGNCPAFAVQKIHTF
jgi:hypothetical protein